MTGIHRGRLTIRILWCALTLGLAGAAWAQAPIPQPAPTPPPQTSPDPLDRQTPAGTVRGFNGAARQGEFVLAARYLQGDNRSAQNVEALARDLNELLDRYFTQRLTTLSDEPTGILDDGLPPSRERLMLTIGDRNVDLYLTRVDERDVGPVWLFASDSLATVPALRRPVQPTWVERVMPRALVTRSYLGASLAQWILWAASIVVPFSLFWGLALVFGALVKWRIGDPTRRAVFQSWWKGIRWLVALALALGAHLSLLRLLGFSLTFRFTYARSALIAGVVILALLFWRLVSVTFQQARVFALRRGRTSTESLILLGERVVKVLVITIAILGTLSLAGLDLTTALAGVGIAGIAIALGAQKSVENLLGGIFLLTDRVLAIGDYCRLSDREGWVEDITLRSVRLRTLQHSLLSVPAGLLAQGSIENFSSRRKILVQSVLRLRYGTTALQLKTVLDGIRRLLAQQPQLEGATARIRLIDFGSQGVELELFAYVLTSDYSTYLGVREQLLLEIAGIIESAGSDFAAPTEFIHVRGGADAGAEDTGATDRPARTPPRTSGVLKG